MRYVTLFFVRASLGGGHFSLIPLSPHSFSVWSSIYKRADPPAQALRLR